MVQISSNKVSLGSRLLQGVTAGLAVLGGVTGAPVTAGDSIVPGRGRTALGMTDVGKAPQPAPRRMLTFGQPASEVTQIPLSGCTEIGYLANTTLGNTLVNIPDVLLTVDTAQADTLIASDRCTDCAVTPKYTSTLSKLGNPNPVSGNWEGATWQGITVDDIMDLGQDQQSQFIFAALTSQTDVFNTNSCIFDTAGRNTYQGVLGMGPLTLSQSSITSGFLWALDSLPSYSFALGMCDNGGYLFLGGNPISSQTGTIVTTPLVESKYYAIALNDISVGGKSLGLSQVDLGPGIIGSGTAQLVLPGAVYKRVVDAVTAANIGLPATFFANGRCIAQPGNYDAQRLPALTLFMDDANADGESSSWTFAGDNSYVYYVKSQQPDGTDAICPGIAASSSTSPVTVWGRTLMRNTVLTVDWNNRAVSIGESQGLCI